MLLAAFFLVMSTFSLSLFLSKFSPSWKRGEKEEGEREREERGLSLTIEAWKECDEEEDEMKSFIRICNQGKKVGKEEDEKSSSFHSPLPLSSFFLSN